MPLHSVPALHRAGRWVGGGRTVCREGSGEQRAWRRTGALLASKGKVIALFLLGVWWDEPMHPQLLLPPCWEKSGSGEPGRATTHPGAASSALAAVEKGLEPPASNQFAGALPPSKPGWSLGHPGRGQQTLPLLPLGSVSGERCSAEATAFTAQINHTGLNLRFLTADAKFISKRTLEMSPCWSEGIGYMLPFK